jgi:hypothetical protein
VPTLYDEAMSLSRSVDINYSPTIADGSNAAGNSIPSAS